MIIWCCGSFSLIYLFLLYDGKIWLLAAVGLPCFAVKERYEVFSSPSLAHWDPVFIFPRFSLEQWRMGPHSGSSESVTFFNPNKNIQLWGTLIIFIDRQYFSISIQQRKIQPKGRSSGLHLTTSTSVSIFSCSRVHCFSSQLIGIIWKIYKTLLS